MGEFEIKEIDDLEFFKKQKKRMYEAIDKLDPAKQTQKYVNLKVYIMEREIRVEEFCGVVGEEEISLNISKNLFFSCGCFSKNFKAGFDILSS